MILLCCSASTIKKSRVRGLPAAVFKKKFVQARRTASSIFKYCKAYAIAKYIFFMC